MGPLGNAISVYAKKHREIIGTPRTSANNTTAIPPSALWKCHTDRVQIATNTTAAHYLTCQGTRTTMLPEVDFPQVAVGRCCCRTTLADSGPIHSPMGISAPLSPTAANSHSASVGRRKPAHSQYDVASCQDTSTTGPSSPHSRDLSLQSTGEVWPVAVTNFLNCPLVTTYLPIRNAATSTLCGRNCSSPPISYAPQRKDASAHLYHDGVISNIAILSKTTFIPA